MKAVGIIAEYNPFHNGHLYHLKKVKELYPDYTIVLVLGGNFLQRGEPSIIDKWKKTNLAINYGVDLVIELPYPFATQSADFFAKGAISILNHLKVETIVFGSETNNIENIEKLVDVQLNHPEYQTLTNIYLKEGYNYPTALSKALYDLTGKEINLPNDILGISYVKEIKKQNCNIIPVCIQRTNDYHNTELQEKITSATSIRKALKEDKNIEGFVPGNTFKYLQKDLCFIDDYFSFLKYKIITSKDLSIYHTVEEGIEKRIKKAIKDATNFDELIQKIKTKRYTYNKISRMLIHILCGFTKEEANHMQEIEYLRVLGFNTNGRNYLNQIKKQVNIPIITKFKREKPAMLDLEQRITSIYALPLTQEKQINLIEQEYKHCPLSIDNDL